MSKFKVGDQVKLAHKTYNGPDRNDIVTIQKIETVNFPIGDVDFYSYGDNALDYFTSNSLQYKNSILISSDNVNV